MLTVTHAAAHAMLEQGRTVLWLPIATCRNPAPIAVIAAIAEAAPIVDDVRPLGVLTGSVRQRGEIEFAIAIVELPIGIRESGKKIADRIMRCVGLADKIAPPPAGWR